MWQGRARSRGRVGSSDAALAGGTHPTASPSVRGPILIFQLPGPVSVNHSNMPIILDSPTGISPGQVANQTRCPPAGKPPAQPEGTEPPMGTGDGDDPRSQANRGWRWGWTPDPGNLKSGIGMGAGLTPDPRQIGDGGGDGDRGSVPWNERELRSEHA